MAVQGYRAPSRRISRVGIPVDGCRLRFADSSPGGGPAVARRRRKPRVPCDSRCLERSCVQIVVENLRSVLAQRTTSAEQRSCRRIMVRGRKGGSGRWPMRPQPPGCADRGSEHGQERFLAAAEPNDALRQPLHALRLSSARRSRRGRMVKSVGTQAADLQKNHCMRCRSKALGHKSFQRAIPRTSPKSSTRQAVRAAGAQGVLDARPVSTASQMRPGLAGPGPRPAGLQLRFQARAANKKNSCASDPQLLETPQTRPNLVHNGAELSKERRAPSSSLSFACARGQTGLQAAGHPIGVWDTGIGIPEGRVVVSEDRSTSSIQGGEKNTERDQQNKASGNRPGDRLAAGPVLPGATGSRPCSRRWARWHAFPNILDQGLGCSEEDQREFTIGSRTVAHRDSTTPADACTRTTRETNSGARGLGAGSPTGGYTVGARAAGTVDEGAPRP